jgi:hypothetical protein
LSNKKSKSVEIQVDPNFLKFVVEVENDSSKVVSEILYLWAKERVPTFPINNEF